MLDRTLEWTPEQRNRERNAFFYEELVPRRTAMLQVADRVANVNELALERAEESFSRDLARFRFASIFTLSITLIGGWLEESRRAQADLKESSAKLLRARKRKVRPVARIARR